MKRYLIKFLLNFFLLFKSPEWDKENTRVFIMKQYKIQKKSDSNKEMNNLFELENILVSLGWLKDDCIDNSNKIHYQPEITTESENLSIDNIFINGILTPGSGKLLHFVDSGLFLGDRDKLPCVMEKLLRHVEVKREKSFQKFSKVITLEEQYFERYEISILFSKYSRIHNDLRFLNAAFKMNDWYLNNFVKSAKKKNTIKLLICLAEQELSAQVLLKC